MNYAIMHRPGFQKIVEVPNMDFVPVIIDYALENELTLMIYFPEMRYFRKLDTRNNEVKMQQINDIAYDFNGLKFYYLEEPLVFDYKNYNYINIIEKL